MNISIDKKHVFRSSAVLLLSSLLFIAACSGQPAYPKAPTAGNNIVVDVSSLRPDQPQFYSHEYKGVRINFFVIRIDDRVLSFLDACLKCYPKKLGFRPDSGSVVCRACNESYPVTEIEKGFASCYPVKLPGSIEGGKYQIDLTTLERMGERFFR